MQRFFFFGSIVFCFLFFQCKSTDIQEQHTSKVSLDSLWEQYEVHTSNLRPESAKNILDSIIQIGQRQNGDPHVVKAIWLKYQSISRKEGGTHGIEYLKEELTSRNTEIDHLLHYITALGYFHYYNNNQWEINSRTTYASSRSEAVDEWGHRQFLEAIHDHLFQAVDTSLLTEATKKWEIVLEELDSTMVQFRPVLYDVMVPEVAEILSRPEMQLLTLAEVKWLKDPALLYNREKFMSLDVQDTLNYLDEAVQFYQKWLRQREQENEVLAHADLSRLKYFHAQSRHPEKDQLFLDALKAFIETYDDEYANAHALYLQAQLYSNWQEKEVEQGLNGYQTAIRKVKELQKMYPNTPYAKSAQNIVDKIQQPFLSVQAEKVNVPDESILVSLRAKNLDQFSLEAYKIEYAQLEEFRRTNRRDFTDFIKNLDKVGEKEYKIPDRNDFVMKMYEVGFPSLSTGLYVFMAKAKESVQWQTFEVSDLATFTLGGNQIMVVDRTNGAPIPDATVTLEERDWMSSSNKTKTFTTNQEGSVVTEISSRRNYIIQKVEKEDRTHYPELNVYNSIYSEGVNSRTKIHLFTDRSIYRPGQTVYFKGIVYQQQSRSDWSVQKQKKLEVSLRDQNGQDIAKTELTSNAWGSVEGFFHIPEEVLTGSMMVHTPFGQAHIKVEEYKRPTFTVELELEKEQQFTIGDSILVNGVAQTLNEIPLDNAEVNYTVRRTYYRPWYISYFPPVHNQAVEIASGTLQTDKNGKFEIKYHADADTSNDYANYAVQVEVTDIGGETQTSEKNISLSRKPFQVVGEVSKLMTQEQLEDLTFKAVNQFGDTLSETVSVKLLKMDGPETGKIERYWPFPDTILMGEEQFRRNFKNYAYRDLSNAQKWKVEAILSQEKLTLNGPTSLPSQLIQKISSGWFQLEFTDDKGEKVSSYYFEKIDAKEAQISTQPQLSILDPVQSIQVEETKSFEYILPYSNSKVYTTVYYPESRHELMWAKDNTIKISPKEGDRGGVSINLIAVDKNRIFTEEKWINVPWTNKELDIQAKTFREILKPGVEEQWTFTVSDPEAELAAVLYDASLDEIYDHDWRRIHFPSYRPYMRISHNGFHSISLRTLVNFKRDYANIRFPDYPSFVFSIDRQPVYHRVIDPQTYEEGIMVQKDAMADGAEDIAFRDSEESSNISDEKRSESESAIRENLNETVFFHPQIHSEDGKYQIEFKMGEALTAWNLFLFAHTKDLKTGVKELQVKTRKELMIRPQLPRFFRSGDSIHVVGRIQNQTGEDQEVNARIVLKNALNGEEINAVFGIQNAEHSLSIQASSSKAVSWKLFIPEADEVPAIRVEMYAETEQWSDGEANILPVVSNRILLTEARPLEVAANSSSTFHLEKWSEQWLNSETAQPLSYGLEFTKQPLWYAVQALPYLTASEYECSEQLVNRLYANSLASKIASEIPQLPEILKQWKKEGQLKSPLQQDEKWKSVDLNSTPWLKNALAETQRMQNIELLLDQQRRQYEINNIIRKLQQWQNADGGFSWFKGGRSNKYMTEYICVQILRMQRMELISDDVLQNILNRAIEYCDKKFLEWYEDYQLDHDASGLGQLHYYYLKSLQGQVPQGEAWETLDSLLRNNWTYTGLYNQALLARSWQLLNKTEMAAQLITSFNERAIKDTVIGAYWNQAGLSRTYVDHIELHALMIEVFVAAGEQEFSNRLKTWLIKNKQTNHWSNTKSTAAAIHSLLLKGDSGLDEEGNVSITADSDQIPWTSASAVDQWHQSFEQEANRQAVYPFNKVSVVNERNHPVWGAAFIQYSERMDAVQMGEQHGLTIKKSYFIEEWGPTGNRLIPLENTDGLHPGDVLVARIIVSVDRSMDFVHLKSERPSNMEPVRQLSGYTFRDGIAYYESVKDLATHFFIDHLPKGTFVFEHRERVALIGECLGGLSQIESMYAPEFRAHTSGKRIQTIEN